MLENWNRSVALAVMALASSSCDSAEESERRDDALPPAVTRSNAETTAAVEQEPSEPSEPSELIVHPLLSEQALAAPRSADMLSRVDDDGFGWTLEEGWGSEDEDEGEIQKYSGLYRVRTVWSSPERRAELNTGKPPRLEKGERPHREPIEKIDPRLLVDDGSGTASDEAGHVMIALRKPQRAPARHDRESSGEPDAEWRHRVFQ